MRSILPLSIRRDGSELGRVTDRKPPSSSVADRSRILRHGRAGHRLLRALLPVLRRRTRRVLPASGPAARISKATSCSSAEHGVPRSGAVRRPAESSSGPSESATSMTFESKVYRIDDDVSGDGPSDGCPRRPRGAEGVPDPGRAARTAPRLRRRRSGGVGTSIPRSRYPAHSRDDPSIE
jgi:hypothetical protein